MGRLSDEELDHLCSEGQGRRVIRAAVELRERRAADLTTEDREALAFARKVVAASEELFSDRISDPKIAAHMERCRAALAALDKLLKEPKP